MSAITRNITVNPPSPFQKNEVRPFFEDAPTRIKLYGIKTTQKRLCQEIANLLLGKSHYQYPLSQTQVCKTLHLDKKTVRKYTRIAAQYGFLKIDEKGKLQHPEIEQSEFVLFGKNHKILSDGMVSEWHQDLLTRKGGKPLKSWKNRIRNLEKLCNTCRINPSQILVSQKNTENIVRSYVQLYLQGKSHKDPRGLRTFHDVSNITYHIAQAVRDFCGYYGMVWKRGIGGVMSQKVPNHGKYADIRLSESELEQADQYIKERFGLDSDVYRWFWIGIESCARFDALYNMSPSYTKHTSQKTGRVTYIMTVYESKTESVRNGKWFKYITRPDTQKSIDLVKSKNTSRIYKSTLPKYRFRKYISESLRVVYKNIGRTEPYFYHRTTHTLRHIGAHYWLAKKDYNYGLVAEIGGWHTIDELKKSYGQIPPERILELIEN